MPKFIFKGVVIPERACVSLSRVTVTTGPLDGHFFLRLTVSIDLSQISVVAEIVSGTTDLLTMRNTVESAVRGMVDAIGFRNGCGYDVEITSVTSEDGSQTVFGVDIPEIAVDKDSRLSFQKIVTSVISVTPFAALMLSDLRESIRNKNSSAFLCYRAIESMRQYFVQESDGDNRTLSWERLREGLNVSANYIKKIADAAKPQRHGDSPFTFGPDRIDVIKRAWKVADRFMRYVAQGSGLDPNEFPILDD